MRAVSKSSLEEIRSRFDKDVERFSNLDTGQQTIPDASLMLELCTASAAASTPAARTVLDMGCGAGNFTLKLLQKLPGLSCHLIDLSLPMLERAQARVAVATNKEIYTTQTDMLSLEIEPGSVDIILAGAVLHHLRDDASWKTLFARFYQWLSPGGSLWISDMVDAETEALQMLFRRRYAEFLETLGGGEYRQKVLDYVEKEDSPRSVTFQLDLLRDTGFSKRELLHKNGSFAAFGAVK